MEKQKEAEKKRIDDFRAKTQKRIHEFIKDGTKEDLKVDPMDKTMRAIVHEVAEVAGLASFSFGLEEEDRYVHMWKKEFAPSDEELLAYRKGEEYDPEKAKEQEKAKEREDQEDKERSKQKSKEVPASNYRDKYKHLIGDEAAKDAAREMVSNISYGNVPASNKRDQRTIEQVMADTRAKKKQKLDHNIDPSIDSMVTSSSQPEGSTHVGSHGDALTTIGSSDVGSSEVSSQGGLS